MKKLSILAIVLLLVSCARTQSGVSSAWFVTSWNDTMPGTINNSVELRKEGKSCTINVLGVYSGGDSSIETARRKGDIKKVAFVDTNYFSLLNIFQIGCTIVNGE